METEGKKILVNYLTDIANTFRSITGETDTISAQSFSKEVQTVATSSSKNSYQRRSIEEMNAITDMKEGDTCLCYHINSFNITEDATVSTITFPKEVTFENAITEYYRAEIRAADSSIDLWGMIRLSPSNFIFRVDKMDDQSRADVFYSSGDGITYTLESPRVEGSFELVNERTVNFKINIAVQNTNEHIGTFLIGIDQVFDGLYKYDGNWKILSLNYPLNEYNVEVSKRYYNNGEQEGLLGATGTLQGVQKLNDFVKKYGTDFVYPKDMSSCFLGYEGERIPLLELNPNTSNVTNMQNLFYGCDLKSIPAINTQNVTNMSFMFRDCSKLSSVPVLDTSNVSNMSNMFCGCSSLASAPLLNTSNVIDMQDMFRVCRSFIEIPALDTGKVVDMSGMFAYCSSLKKIPLLDTKSCKYMNEIFRECLSITEIPELNTGNVTNMDKMFWECTSLATVPMLDASKTGSIYGTFSNCSSLITLGGLKNLGMGYGTGWNANSDSLTLNLSDSPLLTHDSLMNVINNLYDIKSKGIQPQLLWLGDTNKAKLTAEEIAIATNKGWNVK